MAHEERKPLIHFMYIAFNLLMDLSVFSTLPVTPRPLSIQLSLDTILD
jgi:hypothetical protein